jgi:hypothetical protein
VSYWYQFEDIVAAKRPKESSQMRSFWSDRDMNSPRRRCGKISWCGFTARRFMELRQPEAPHLAIIFRRVTAKNLKMTVCPKQKYLDICARLCYPCNALKSQAE